MDKEGLIKSLPIVEDRLSIRFWERADLDRLSQWPSYPFPYEPFNFSFKDMSCEEKTFNFDARKKNQNRVTLIIDYELRKTVGYLSLVEIDWDKMIVHNMGFRIAPSWCNRGIGTKSMAIVSQWCFGKGFEILRLDVAASNEPAIRCYKRCRFTEAGEFWRDEMKLREVDLNEEKYDFLREHIRFKNGVPQLRFLWMESRTNE